MSASSTTTVSEPSTTRRGCAGRRSRTAGAFSAASRSTSTRGASPARASSSTSAGTTSKRRPARASRSRRRGDALASTSRFESVEAPTVGSEYRGARAASSRSAARADSGSFAAMRGSPRGWGRRWRALAVRRRCLAAACAAPVTRDGERWRARVSGASVAELAALERRLAARRERGRAAGVPAPRPARAPAGCTSAAAPAPRRARRRTRCWCASEAPRVEREGPVQLGGREGWAVVASALERRSLRHGEDRDARLGEGLHRRLPARRRPGLRGARGRLRPLVGQLRRGASG